MGKKSDWAKPMDGADFARTQMSRTPAPMIVIHPNEAILSHAVLLDEETGSLATNDGETVEPSIEPNAEYVKLYQEAQALGPEYVHALKQQFSNQTGL